jgi:DNA-binding MarR family transcriptional regulator
MNKDAIRRMFEDVSLGAPENAVGFVMWRIVGRYQREMDRALAAIDLTHLQFVLLAMVAWFGRSGRAVTQIDLARSGGIQPMQVSQTIRVLEAKRLLSRTRSSTDTRAKRVEVTSAGLKSLRRAMPIAIAVQRKLFGESGQPGGALLRTVRQVHSNMPEEETERPADVL